MEIKNPYWDEIQNQENHTLPEYLKDVPASFLRSNVLERLKNLSLTP